MWAATNNPSIETHQINHVLDDDDISAIK
jgi:hypothetical protein